MTDTPDNQIPDSEVRGDQELSVTGPFTDDVPEEDGVGKAIGMEANMILKGILPPEDGTLSEGQKLEIRAIARAHLEQHGITKREVSRQTRIPTSTLSEVLKGTYPKSADTPRLLKINAWLNNDEHRRRTLSTPNGFHTTAVFKAIKGLATFAKSHARIPGHQRSGVVQQEASRIAIGVGPAGCGKSMGAAALHHSDTTSILIRLQQGSKGTDSGLARLILAAAGWKGAPRNRTSIDFIIDKLKDTGNLLIVDEGHRLVFSGCELLRDLADVCGIPILILATSEFSDRMTKVRTGSGFARYDQFSSRVGLVCELMKGLDGQGGKSRPIFDVKEIQAIFTSEKVRISTDAVEYMQAVACTIGLGMLREAGNTFNLALRSANARNKQVIDEALLRKCAKKSLIPAGSSDCGVLVQIDQTLQTNRAMQPKAMQA